MNTPFRCLAFSLLLAVAPLSQAEKVYRWVDADGVAHFSAAPPPGQQVQAENLHYQKAPEVDPVRAARDKQFGELHATRQEEQKRAAADDSRAQAKAEIRAQHCAQAQAIVDRLQRDQAIRYKRDDGTYARYSDAEQAEKMDAARAAVEANCD